MVKNWHSHLFNLLVLLIGIVLFFSARAIEIGRILGRGSELVPILMTSLWVILAVIIVISDLRKPEELSAKIKMRPLLITLAILFGYVLLLRPIGFVLTSMVYCFIQIIVFAPEDKLTKKDYIIFGVVSVVSPIIINNIFAKLFSIFLPQGDIIRLPFLF
jgi:hypothetical protein